MTDFERLEGWTLDGNPVHRHDPDSLSFDEDVYWHESYRHQATFDRHALYEDYSPAYRAGYLYRMRHQNRSWEQAEHDLSCGWEKIRGVSRLAWSDARPAVRAAWEHVAEIDGQDEE